MSGAYCQFCDRRCFVDRRLPSDASSPYAGQVIHLATCVHGKAYDRAKTGHDAASAINPYVGATS